MKQWQDIWPAVELVLGDCSTIRDKVESISALRGAPTTWEAIRRAKRRYAGSTIVSRPTRIEDFSSSYLKLPIEKIRKPGKPTTTYLPQDGDVWGYASDIHFGIEDIKALRMMLRCFNNQEVSRVVLAGDVFDCYSLSKYDHVPYPKREVYTIEDEAKCAVWFWDALSELDVPADLLPGNHEDRVWSLEKNNPGLVNSASIRGLYGVPDFVTVHEQYGRILAGDLVIEHGHKLPGSLSANGAAKVLKDHPYQHTVYGHTHRFETRMHTVHMPDGTPRTFGAYSIGHMSIAEHHIDYSPDSSWQQGFALIHWRAVDTDRGLDRMIPTVEPVVIQEGSFVAAGVRHYEL